MNDCKKYDLLISSMIDGEITEDERAELDAHLKTCPECRSYLNVLKSVGTAVGDTIVQPPDKLAEGIMYKIRLEYSRKHHHLFGFGRYTAIAAVFCLILFGAYKLIPLLDKNEVKGTKANNSYVMASKSEAAGGGGYGTKAAVKDGAAENKSIMDVTDGASDNEGTADDSSGDTVTERNTIIPGEGETGSSEHPKIFTAAAPAPAATTAGSGSTIGQASPEYAAENSRGYEIYKNLNYDESFYSVCFVYGTVPDEIKDCEVLYTSDGQTHYKVPLETMLKLELAKKFNEIYYDNGKADYGLVIVLGDNK